MNIARKKLYVRKTRLQVLGKLLSVHCSRPIRIDIVVSQFKFSRSSIIGLLYSDTFMSDFITWNSTNVLLIIYM